MDINTTVDITAEIGRVWEALANPESWPAWMPDVTSVEALSSAGRAEYGARYRVAQSWWRMNDQEILISEIREPEFFAFTASTTTGSYRFEYVLHERQPGTVHVEHRLSSDGLISSVAGAMGGSSMEKQLIAEAAALRDHCESRNAG